MRRLFIAFMALAFAGVLQGCNITKTTFGGRQATEDNRSSSAEQQPLPPFILNQAPLFTWTEEATYLSYNEALGLKWVHPLGDWIDANGDGQGGAPFVTVPLIDDDTEKTIDVDVTAFVMRFGADFRFNKLGGSSYAFHSREASDSTKRPLLIVERGALVSQLDASADVSIDSSTTSSRGADSTLNTADGFLLRFDFVPDTSVTKVTLRLRSTGSQFGDQALELYRPDARPVLPASPVYLPGDSNDVSLSLGGSQLYSLLTGGDRSRSSVDAKGSLVSAIPLDESVALASRIALPPASRSSEIFLRTVMQLSRDFDPSSAGVLPGLSGTGWAARLVFDSDPSATYGDEYLKVRGDSSRPEAGFALPLRRGEFFVLDQRVKLNTINADGSVRADGEWSFWYDGLCVMNLSGLVWRTSASDTPTDIDLAVQVVTGYRALHSHSVVIDSMTVSRRLLPFDSNALAALNSQ